MKATKSIQKKVILMGSFATGKTALVQRFVFNQFPEAYESTGEVSIAKKLLVPEEEGQPVPLGVNLSIWDFGDLALDREGSAAFFSGAHAVIWVVDLSRPVSWLGLRHLMNKLALKLPAVPVLLAANKLDLVQRDTLAEPLHRAQLTPDAWVSAKTGQGVAGLFQDVARLVLQ
ncbi:MAG: hypothetical protein GC205_07165 [Bacteroidetes bacterium]|nr:hypothetical protein [Bacteroidota bacterium]